MRYRKPSNYKEKLSTSEHFISEEKALKNKTKWIELFPKFQDKLMVEIGCGKGGFLIEMAKRNPQINFIGIERTESLLLHALEEIDEKRMNNIVLCGLNAYFIENFFGNNEIDRIYLNFSDPWPKKRNAKRRLTEKNFLAKYSRILKNKKELFFKTDNKGLFEFTLMEMSQRGDLLTSLDIDLHSKVKMDHDERFILTEYEKRFMEQDIPIYRLEANLN